MDRENQPDIFSHDGASHSFDVVIRGYDRAQVHDVVDRLDGELRVALADKDASGQRAEELAGHLSAAQAEVDSLRRTAESAAAPNFESMGARISHMLSLAEEEANDIRRIAADEHTRSQAELTSTAQAAARLRSEAQDEARRMAEEAQAEARRSTEEATAAAAKTVAQAQAESDALNERARASAEKAEQESKARVAKIEEDFQLAQKARRAEASRVEQERDQSSRRDAQNRIEQAQRESDDMVAAAEQRVTDLDAQRAELHARLSQVRELLGGLPETGTATVIDPSAAKPRSAPSGANSDSNPVSQSNGQPPPDKASKSGTGKDPVEKPRDDQTNPAGEVPREVQGTPPPPPTAKAPAPPSWPVNSPTQAIPIPRQG